MLLVTNDTESSQNVIRRARASAQGHRSFLKCLSHLLFLTGSRQGAWDYPSYEPDYLRKATEQQQRRSSFQRQPSDRHAHGRHMAVSFQDTETPSHFIPVHLGCTSWWKRPRRLYLVCNIVNVHCCLTQSVSRAREPGQACLHCCALSCCMSLSTWLLSRNGLSAK